MAIFFATENLAINGNIQKEVQYSLLLSVNLTTFLDVRFR